MKKEVRILFGSLTVIMTIIISGCVQDINVTPDEIPTKSPESSTPRQTDWEMMKKICAEETWPSECNMIPSVQRKDICDRCKGMNKDTDAYVKSHSEDSTKKDEHSQYNGMRNSVLHTRLDGCKEKNAVFTSLPMDIENIKAVEPQASAVSTVGFLDSGCTTTL